MAISSNGVAGLRTGVCTSTTRPSGPYEGQMIYETDTDKVLVWNGSAWYANWNLPWGSVGVQTLTTSFVTSAVHNAFQDNGMTLTINEVSGRLYRITAFPNLYPNGGLQGVSIRILRDGVGLDRGDYSTNIMDTGVSIAIVFSSTYTAVSSGSATFKVQVGAQTSNTAVSDYGDATYKRQFIIEDIGPA